MYGGLGGGSGVAHRGGGHGGAAHGSAGDVHEAGKSHCGCKKRLVDLKYYGLLCDKTFDVRNEQQKNVP